MQLLFALAPLAAFFISFRLAGIYTATAVLMGTMVLLTLIEYLRTRRVSTMHLISTALILVFGGATLLLHNPLYIKWKASVFLWLLALAFLASPWFGGKTFAERMLHTAVPEGALLPARRWLLLNAAWVLWFLLLGVANLWIAYHASNSQWVSFKAIGLPLAIMALSVAEVLWLQRRAEAPSARVQSDQGALAAAAPVGDPATRVARIRASLAVLSPSELEVVDDSAAHVGHAGAGGLGHFRVRIVSRRFEGLAPLARHRLVNDTLAPLFRTDIHALSIDAQPEQT